MRWYKEASPSTPANHVAVNVTDRDALFADIDARFAEGRGFSVATLNLDHVVKLRRQPDFRDAYVRQSHVTADGNPIVWLMRLAGQEVSLVPGSEIVEPVAELAARHEIPVALFGATDASLSAAADALQDRYPGIRVVAKIAPPWASTPPGPRPMRKSTLWRRPAPGWSSWRWAHPNKRCLPLGLRKRCLRPGFCPSAPGSISCLAPRHGLRSGSANLPRSGFGGYWAIRQGWHGATGPASPSCRD